ncbi:hypothetical protein ACJJTC_017361 [Scirpophaga incertulas]
MAQKQRASDIIGKALRFSKSVKRRINFDEIIPNKQMDDIGKNNNITNLTSEELHYRQKEFAVNMNETVVTAHPNSPSINKIELATVDSVEYPVNQNNIMFFYTSKDTSIDNTIDFTTSSTSELMACQAMATIHTDITETSKMSIPINDETLLSYDLSLQGQSDKLPIVQTEITQHVTDELMPQTPIINNVTLQEQANRQDTLEREMIEHQLEDKMLWPPSIATPEIMTLISNKTSDLIEPIASTSSNEVVQSPLMLNSNEKTDPTVAKKKAQSTIK